MISTGVYGELLWEEQSKWVWICYLTMRKALACHPFPNTIDLFFFPCKRRMTDADEKFIDYGRQIS